MLRSFLALAIVVGVVAFLATAPLRLALSSLLPSLP